MPDNHLNTVPLFRNGKHTLNFSHARHALLACLLSFSHSSIAENPHWQQAEYIQSSFIEIALNNEHSVKVSTVRKWTQPIYYSIVHRTADKTLHQHITEIHLKQLANITNIPIQAVSANKKENLRIIFSTEKLIRKELQQDFLLNDQKKITDLSLNSVCLAHFSTNPDNSIKQAIIIIPVDRARAHAKLLSCVVEELTQIMGLPNDSDKVFPSIFNDKSHDDYLSGLDFLLLKLLYHPNIKQGMNRKQLEYQLKQIITSDNFQQLIKNSEILVRQQGLYRLLN